MKVHGKVVNDEKGEDDEETDGWWNEGDDDELDPVQVEAGRKDEVDFMVEKLDMFEFGSYEDAVRRGGKQPTTTRWVEGWKADDKGGRFVRCRVVGRDFKQRKGGYDREDVFAAMPPLETKKLFFRVRYDLLNLPYLVFVGHTFSCSLHHALDLGLE